MPAFLSDRKSPEMRLESLRIRNYRLLDNVDVIFPPTGIIGLVGSNGTGKSSFLEGIQYGAYGTDAADGPNEELVGADGPDSLVELGFVLGDQHFLVRRRLLRQGADSRAALFVDSAAIDPDQASEKLAPNGNGDHGPKLIASGSSAVTAALVEKIGGFKEAKISRFVGQDQLNELSNLKPADRKRLILHLLGIDAVEVAIASLRRQVLDRDKLVKIRRGLLPNKTEIDDELKTLSASERGLLRDQTAATKVETTTMEEARRAETALAELERKAAATAEQNATLTELDQALVEVDERESDIERREQHLAGVAGRLAESEARRAAAEEARPEYEILEQAAALRAALPELTRQATELASRIARLEPQQRDLRERADAEQGLLARQVSAANQRDKYSESVTLNERERTDLATAFERNREEQRSYGVDLKAGAASVCRTCGQKVEPDEYKRHIEEQLEATRAAGLRIAEDGKLARTKLDGAIAGRDKAETELRVIEGALASARSAASDLRLVDADLASRREQAAAVTAQMAEATAIVYDAARHTALIDVVMSIPGLDGLISGYRGELSERAALAEARTRLSARRSDLLARSDGVRASLAAAGYDPAAHELARTAAGTAREAATAARLESTRLAGERERVADGITRAREKEAYHARMKAEIVAILEEKGEIELTREAMDRFKLTLIGRIRPLLSRKSSGLLRDLSDGRYSELSLDVDYEMQYGDAGKLRAIRMASGGERNLMNLCLRLAVSELINETTGIGRTFLTLDEVLGSQDDERRENIVAALPKLAAHFGQVLMVAHNREVQDLFEHVIRFNYDRASDRTQVRFPLDALADAAELKDEPTPISPRPAAELVPMTKSASAPPTKVATKAPSAKASSDKVPTVKLGSPKRQAKTATPAS